MKKKSVQRMKPNAIINVLARKAHIDALQKQFDEYIAMEYVLTRAQMARELYEQFQDMTKEEILEFLDEWDAWEN